MSPFAEIHKEDVEAGSTALCIDFSSRGINFLLKSTAIRNDQLERLPLTAFTAVGGEAAGDRLWTLGFPNFSRLEILLSFRHSEARPQRGECRYKSQPHLQTPYSVQMRIIAFSAQRLCKACQHNKSDDCAYEITLKCDQPEIAACLVGGLIRSLPSLGWRRSNPTAVLVSSNPTFPPLSQQR